MMMDADKIAAFWLWFGVVALFAQGGTPDLLLWLGGRAVRRVRRYRLRRRNLATVRRLEVLHRMNFHGESGA